MTDAMFNVLVLVIMLVIMLAAAPLGVYGFLRWQRHVAQMREGRLLGAVKDFEVRVVQDEGGRRMIAVIYQTQPYKGPPFYGLFPQTWQPFRGLATPSQGRQFAEWLRIAAAPGKTIAEARRNARQPPQSLATSR